MLKLLLSLIFILFAETNEVKSNDSSSKSYVTTTTTTTTTAPTNSDDLKVFDDKVLDIGKRVEPGPSSFTTPRGSTFYKAPAPNFNAEQKRKAIEACSFYKEKDMESFRKCYSDEISKQIKAVKTSILNVEKKQSKPLRNVPLKEDTKKKPEIDIEYE